MLDADDPTCPPAGPVADDPPPVPAPSPTPAAEQRVHLDFDRGLVILTVRRQLDIEPIRIAIPMLVWKSLALQIMRAEIDAQLAVADLPQASSRIVPP